MPVKHGPVEESPVRHQVYTIPLGRKRRAAPEYPKNNSDSASTTHYVYYAVITILLCNITAFVLCNPRKTRALQQFPVSRTAGDFHGGVGDSIMMASDDGIIIPCFIPVRPIWFRDVEAEEEPMWCYVRALYIYHRRRTTDRQTVSDIRTVNGRGSTPTSVFDVLRLRPY
ncbi:hypothetical protein QTP88_003235 [Uroleucon formosanum]